MLARTSLRECFTILLVAFAAAALLVLTFLVPRATMITPDAPEGVVEFWGFHDAEVVEGARARWTRPQATLDLPHPGGRALLDLSLGGLRAQPVALNLAVGSTAMRFSVASAPRIYRLLVPPPAWTTSRLTLAFDAPPVPKAIAQHRKLGVLVGAIALRGTGAPPPMLALLVALTAAGSYGALRFVGLRRWRAVGAALALAAALSAWLILDGWEIRFAMILTALLATTCALVPLLFRRQEAGGRGQGLGVRGQGSGSKEARKQGNKEPGGRSQKAGGRSQLITVSSCHLVILSLVTLAARLPFVWADDLIGDHVSFADWGRWMLAHGLHDFYNPLMDYPPLWRYAVWGIAALATALDLRFSVPLPPLTQLFLKLPAIFADLAFVLVLYRYARRYRAPRIALVIALAFALLPAIWLNSSWWGQIDMLPALPMALALLWWERAGERYSWALFALGLMIKAQGIIFAPLMVVATWRARGMRGLVGGGLAAALVALLVCAPVVAAGEGGALLASYTTSVGRQPQLSFNAYNIWYLFTLGKDVPDATLGQIGPPDVRPWLGPLTYYQVGMLLLGALTLFVCVVLLRRSTTETRLLAAILLAVGFFMLPTQMHERYIYPALPLLALWWARADAGRWPFWLFGLSNSLNLLRTAPFIPAFYALLTPIAVPLALAALNLAGLLWLCIVAWRASGRRSTSALMALPAREIDIYTGDTP